MAIIDTLLVSFSPYRVGRETLADLKLFVDHLRDSQLKIGIFAPPEINWLLREHFKFVDVPRTSVSIEDIESLLTRMCRDYRDTVPNGYLFVPISSREDIQMLSNFLTARCDGLEVDRLLCPDDNIHHLQYARLGFFSPENVYEDIPEYITTFPDDGKNLDLNLDILFGLFKDTPFSNEIDIHLLNINRYLWNHDDIELLDRIFIDSFYSFRFAADKSTLDLIIQQLLEIFIENYARNSDFREKIESLGSRMETNIKFYETWFLDSDREESPLENFVTVESDKDLVFFTDKSVLVTTDLLDPVREKYKPLFYPCFRNRLVEVAH